LIEAIGPRADDTIVVLRDVIDCGPDSKGVLDHLIALAGDATSWHCSGTTRRC
jgi:hypothetical protein